MASTTDSTSTQIAAVGGMAGLMGTVLTRVVVPLWLLAGALLKLVDTSPAHLPAALIKWLGPLGVDLMFVVRFSISVELAVVGVMWLLPSLARPLGLAMLGAFMPILIGDVAMGASSCGCFGSLQVSPWVSLVLDVSFFLGILILGRYSPALQWRPSLPAGRVVMAGIWTVAAFVVGFLPVTRAESKAEVPVAEASVVVADPAADASALPQDGYYVPDLDSWVGQRFSDLDIARWIQGLPEDLEEGIDYLLFYRKDCEHCHELVQVYFTGPLDIPTVAVAIPDRAGWPDTQLPFECDECRLSELPAGVDWFFQTPVLVRLNEGVVACASETSAADPRCVAF
jgi:hypothetical protein